MAYASLFAPRSSPITPVAGRARHTAVHRSGDGGPEVYLHVDGKPVAEALTLDKGTVTLTHRLDKGSHQIRISDAGNSCGTSFGPTEARPLPFGTAQPMDKCSKGTDFNLRVMLAGTTSSPSTPIPPASRCCGQPKERVQTPASGRALHQLGWRPGHDITQGSLARRHPVAGCLLGTGSRGQRAAKSS